MSGDDRVNKSSRTDSKLESNDIVGQLKKPSERVDTLFYDKSFVPEVKYEYLDHTADIQIHSWGENLREAFEQTAMGMFGLITTELDTIEMNQMEEITVEQDDMLNLLYHFLDEFLFLFSAEPYFIPRKIQITSFDPVNFKLTARGYGEPFQIGKHPQGCDIKAITYSNMQIHSETNNIYVIVDI
ncbi:hypothetical protein GJ496_004593 [Pomphorhynchus laevis]|nr:hypothetical protein GJ496_004593 [Pomphorhynchus laevis]